MANDPVAALRVLRAAAADGRLDALCVRHGLRVLTVFGSTVSAGTAAGAPAPRDLDVAVSGEVDVLALLDDLAVLTSCDVLDLLLLDRAGPVARERALVGCVPLYEDRRGAYANAQMAAMCERMDTAWMRKRDLSLMAE